MGCSLRLRRVFPPAIHRLSRRWPQPFPDQPASQRLALVSHVRFGAPGEPMERPVQNVANSTMQAPPQMRSCISFPSSHNSRPPLRSITGEACARSRGI